MGDAFSVPFILSCGEANNFHPKIKFTAEISENREITFLDTTVFKGERFKEKSILDIKTHYNSYKPSETFQYTHFTSCHPPEASLKARQ